MALEALTQRQGIRMESVEVDGMRVEELRLHPTLTPEQIASMASVSTGADNGSIFYNHHHCVYSRCVLRAE